MRLLRLAAILVVGAGLSTGAAATEEDRPPGTLRVGTAADYPPFHSAADGSEPEGFDIDIARALCARIERECSFEVGDWEQLIANLAEGDYDLVVASVPITEARANEVIFTEPYYRSPLALVARKDAGLAANDAAALAGKRVGARQQTSASRQLATVFPNSEARTYPTLAAALTGLADREVDAVMAEGGPLSLWLRSEQGSGCCEFVGTTAPAFSDAMGIALKPGDEELRDELNTALEAIVADGTYSGISTRYFPFPIR